MKYDITICFFGAAMKSEDEVIAIITQSEVIRWLWEMRNTKNFPHEALSLRVADFKSNAFMRLSGGEGKMLIAKGV